MKYFLMITIISLTFIKAEIQLIVSSSCNIEQLTKQEIKNLFMLKKTNIRNQYMVVINSKNKELYTKFSKKYIGKTILNMKVYWTRMLFTGRKIAPKKCFKYELDELKGNETCYLSYIKEIEDKPDKWRKLLIQ